MDPKKVSIITVGLIWLLVGIGLSTAGITWILKLKTTGLLFLFLAGSVLIGFLKGKFILQKVAKKYFSRASVINFNKQDIFTGWLKIFGVKGILLIGIMVGLGSFLRHTSIDRPILGILYLAVGVALVYASKIFFSRNEA